MSKLNSEELESLKEDIKKAHLVGVATLFCYASRIGEEALAQMCHDELKARGIGVRKEND